MNIEQLDAALASGDVAAAEQFLRDYFKNEPVTESERGESHAKFALLYMDLINRVNQEYLEQLQGIVSALHQNQQVENRLIDDIDLKAARAKLQE